MHHIQQLRKKSNLNFFTKVPFCNIFQNWLGKFQTINKAREKSWGQKVCRGTAMYKAYCNTFIQCVHLDRDKNLINDSLRSACQWLQLINLEITISSKYIPQLSRAKLILPSSPSTVQSLSLFLRDQYGLTAWWLAFLRGGGSQQLPVISLLFLSFKSGPLDLMQESWGKKENEKKKAPLHTFDLLKFNFDLLGICKWTQCRVICFTYQHLKGIIKSSRWPCFCQCYLCAF